MGRSEELFRRARRAIPGGVNSPVRAFGAVGGTPRFVARGEGAYLVDVDGNRYVDLVQSWGALLFGHAREEVVRAAAEAALDRFVRHFAKWPKAVSKLTGDREAPLAFYDFPAEHWIRLRTSNPIESTFAPV